MREVGGVVQVADGVLVDAIRRRELGRLEVRRRGHERTDGEGRRGVRWAVRVQEHTGRV